MGTIVAGAITFAGLVWAEQPTPSALTESGGNETVDSTNVEEQVPMTVLSPGLPAPLFPMSEELRTKLYDGDFTDALQLIEGIDESTLRGPSIANRAFVIAWLLIRLDRRAEAAPLLERVRHATGVPLDYRVLTEAELLLELSQPIEAASVLEDFPADSGLGVRAGLIRAAALQDAGRTADSIEAYEQLTELEDPTIGVDLALWSLAQRFGLGSDRSRPLLERLVTNYPRTQPGIDALASLSNYTPTVEQTATRARRIMAAGAWRSVINFVQPLEATLGDHTEASCDARYSLGRSLFKINEVTRAAALLGPTGRGCAGINDDLGPKALYLAGKSEERKRNWAAAASHYLAIPELYPESSFADDGYSLGGIALLENSDEEGANNAWQMQLDQYPAGDMAGETAWRVAWSRYQAGDTTGALATVDTTLDTMPIEIDRDHFIGARYWSARWRGWPNVEDPEDINPIDGLGKSHLWALFRDICLEHPTSIYSVLAAMRMRELIELSGGIEQGPTEAALQEIMGRLPRSSRVATPEPWRVSESFANEPALLRGVALTRLGLFTEALTELSTLGRDELLPSEALFIEQLRRSAGDEIAAHDFLRKYLQANPPEHLGDENLEFLAAAYPNRFWEEIIEATSNYDWNPRVFHSLVREESNFNPRIISWAGARGLSQLMPRTAQSVAGWLNVPYSRARLFEPAYNLAVGSRYIEHLMNRYGGSPFLALAGYNAGEGNVGRWLRRFGDVPTDEMVESIPIRQTRHYVKRVMSSFQTYNLLYDGGEPILNLHGFVHHAVPSD